MYFHPSILSTSSLKWEFIQWWDYGYNHSLEFCLCYLLQCAFIRNLQALLLNKKNWNGIPRIEMVTLVMQHRLEFICIANSLDIRAKTTYIFLIVICYKHVTQKQWIIYVCCNMYFKLMSYDAWPHVLYVAFVLTILTKNQQRGS